MTAQTLMWHERVKTAERAIKRRLTREELLALAREHMMADEERKTQAESFVRAMGPIKEDNP
mgnify:CR=1 FL=1